MRSAEFTQVADMYHFDHVYFHELFDLRSDPYQLRNIYGEQSAAVKSQLHEMLFKEFRCKGESCASWSDAAPAVHGRRIKTDELAERRPNIIL